MRFFHPLDAHILSSQMLVTINAMLASKGPLLKSGTVVDAKLFDPPNSTKNSISERAPEFRQIKKGNQWHPSMKAHIAKDTVLGLVHKVVGTAANVNDMTRADALEHVEGAIVIADTGCQRVSKRDERQDIEVNCHVAIRTDKLQVSDKTTQMGAFLDQLEQAKARIRAKVEHPPRVVKRMFGYVKVKHQRLAMNSANLMMMFGLSIMWLARKALIKLPRAKG